VDHESVNAPAVAPTTLTETAHPPAKDSTSSSNRSLNLPLEGYQIEEAPEADQPMEAPLPGLLQDFTSFCTEITNDVL